MEGSVPSEFRAKGQLCFEGFLKPLAPNERVENRNSLSVCHIAGDLSESHATTQTEPGGMGRKVQHGRSKASSEGDRTKSSLRTNGRQLQFVRFRPPSQCSLHALESVGRTRPPTSSRRTAQL